MTTLTGSFGSGLAGFGTVIFRTPFDIEASTLDGSTPGGKLQHAHEHTVAAVAVLDVLVLLVLFDPRLAANCEDFIVDGYLGILALEARASPR